MAERITFLPQKRTFLTMCPALGIEKGSTAEVLGAEIDPREGRRRGESNAGSKNIVLSVRVTGITESKVARIVVYHDGRTPRQVLEAIGNCKGPSKAFGRCPILEVIPREKPRSG